VVVGTTRSAGQSRTRRIRKPAAAHELTEYSYKRPVLAHGGEGMLIVCGDCDSLAQLPVNHSRDAERGGPQSHNTRSRPLLRPADAQTVAGFITQPLEAAIYRPRASTTGRLERQRPCRPSRHPAVNTCKPVRDRAQHPGSTRSRTSCRCRPRRVMRSPRAQTPMRGTSASTRHAADQQRPDFLSARVKHKLDRSTACRRTNCSARCAHAAGSSGPDGPPRRDRGAFSQRGTATTS